MNVLPEPPDVPPPDPPGDPFVEETSTVEGPPDDEPLPPGVEEPEITAGPPEEPPWEPEIELSATEGPPDRRVRLSRASTERRRVGRAGWVLRLERGAVQRSFQKRDKRVSVINRLSFEAGTSRHRRGS